MRPVEQTRFGDPEGNCLMAAVCSILEINLDDAPDLYEHEKRGRGWWHVLRDWLLRDHGKLVVWLPVEEGWIADGQAPAGYSVINGYSDRDVRHSCVAYDGRVVHDPHPSGCGLKEGILTGYLVLVPLLMANGARLAPPSRDVRCSASLGRRGRCPNKATKVYVSTRVRGRGRSTRASLPRCADHPLGNAVAVLDIDGASGGATKGGAER